MQRVSSTRVPGLVVLLVAASAALVWLVSSSSAAEPSGESASGHGTTLVTTSDGTVRRQFSFSATRHGDGTVTGHAVLHNPAFEGENGNAYQLHVDVSCLRIVGNVAIIGGTTARTNDPNLVDAVFFTVQDNGEPGKGSDRISSVFFWDDDPTTTGDPQACLLTGPSDFPLQPIESGNIQVRGLVSTP
jgi:hypothetical protein